MTRVANFLKATALVGMAMCSGVAPAQERPPGFEPLTIAPDLNGVDLLSGRITYPLPSLAIPAEPYLSFGRIQDYSLLLTGTIVSTNNMVQILQAINADDWTLAEQLISQSVQPRTVKIYAQIGESVSEGFDCNDGDCISRSSTKSHMIDGSGSGYFLYRQAASGKEVIYNLRYAATQSASGAQFSFYASQVKYADGTIHDLEYDLAQIPGPQNVTLNVRRPIKVRSNRGYELRITYLSSDPYNVNWPTPASAAIYRRGEFSTPLSQLTFQSSSQATDQIGNIWTGNFQNQMGVPSNISAGSYRPPTSPTDQIVALSSATDQRGNLLTMLTKGDQTWNYSYSHVASGGNPYGQRDVTVTGPLGYYRKVTINEPINSTARITKEVDGLNRTINYTYNGSRLVGITLPEGNQIALAYDYIGNVTQRQAIAKPGLGNAIITENAEYPAGDCQTETHDAQIHCFRPNWVRDGKGNQTDYTWDAQHGGMLTETRPAQPDGIRPQKRNEYVERFAWYKNDSGTFVRSPTGIWLKSKERTCRTTATVGNACAGGAVDEVITEYDYGPDNGPNYLLLRGIIVTAANAQGVIESLRTCYTYDARGNKLSETQPMGTGSTCP